MLLLCAPSLPQAQRKSTLSTEIAWAVRKKAPEWKCGNAAPIHVIPKRTKILAENGWYRVPKGGGWESVSASVYEMESSSVASAWLGLVKDKKLAPVHGVEKFEMGDEAYLSKSQDGRTYFMQIRKGKIVIQVSGDSMENVRRFAEVIFPLVSAS